MPESTDLFYEVAIMRDEIEEQGSMLDALVRASGAGKDILDRLAQDPAAILVLLAVDGIRSQQEIASAVKKSEATVSRALTRLAHDFGLVAISQSKAAGKVYHRTRLDKALQISRHLSR